jgi:two-component system, OmpR family, alkaline phosphatase synthesis response regulator PhoP
VELRPKEFALLVALVARPGRVLRRQFLLQHVWAYEPDVTTRTVDWHVARLRSLLGPCGRRLVTVRGAGYRWEADAASRSDTAPGTGEEDEGR